MTVFDDSRLDDQDALRVIDDRLRGLAQWGAQTRRAAESVATVGPTGLSSAERPRAVVAAGRDGRLLRAVVEPTCPVPFVAWPHPGLPGWAGPLDLCVSLSVTGDDVESLGLIAEALRRGADVIAACPAGSPIHELVVGRGTVLVADATEPLSLAVPVLRALHGRGLGPDVEPEPVAAALDQVAADCAPSRLSSDNTAKELALVVGDSVPVMWGGSVLAARVARRLAEMLRSATGRPAVAGDEAQVVPILQRAPTRDIFADPMLDDDTTARPSLIMLDDNTDGELESASRARVLAAAEQAQVPVHTVSVKDGPEVARFGSLLLTGAFAAAYVSVALGTTNGT